MLQAIHDRASGWLAYLIVFLISIPFALWGINRYFGGGDPRVAAEVNGEQIPLRAFNTQFQQQRRYLQEVYGDQAPQQIDDQAIKANVIERMVREELLKQATQAAGYRIGDQVLAQRIRELEVFQRDGRFDKQRYEQLLNAQGRTKTGFEQGLRGQLRLAQLEGGIGRSAFLPSEAQREYRRLRGQTRDLAYFRIPADTEAAMDEVGEEAIAEYYEANKGRYRTPEQVKLAYVELDQQALVDDIRADEDTLFERYQSNLDEYVEPEERQARQILIEVDPNADDQAVEAARAQAEALAARARDGEDFAALAETHSQDELSAEAGGDLGYVARGDLPAAVEKVIFALPEGEVSDPVRTERGFLVVQVTGVKPAEQQAFEAVRDEVEQAYKRREARRRFADQAEQLLTLSYEQSTSLEPAAEAISAQIQTTDWVTPQGGRGMAGNPEVRAAAFSEEVLEEGRNSDLLELSDDHVVVLRALEHEPSLPVPLEGVREQIKRTLAQRAAREAAAEAGVQALAALRDEGSLAAQAKRWNVEVEAPGFVARDAQDAPRPIVDKLFTLPKPQGEAAQTYGGLQLAEGGYAIVALRGVGQGEPGEGDDEAPGAVESAQQAQRYGARELQALYGAVRSGADVTIMRDNL